MSSITTSRASGDIPLLKLYSVRCRRSPDNIDSDPCRDAAHLRLSEPPGNDRLTGVRRLTIVRGVHRRQRAGCPRIMAAPGPDAHLAVVVRGEDEWLISRAEEPTAVASKRCAASGINHIDHLTDEATEFKSISVVGHYVSFYTDHQSEGGAGS